MQRDRTTLLHALIAYELPIEPVLAELRSFGWDAPAPLVLLTKQDIVCILDRYLAGELGAADVADWANQIECRDDLGFPGIDEDALSDTVFRLANPDLTEDLSPELAQTIRRELLGGNIATS
jgi:hypothetical protein